MFNGEESVRIRSALPRAKIEEAIEDAVGRLGVVEFRDRGAFEISGGKFKSFATDVRVDGKLSQGRKAGEWVVRMTYSVQPSAACWVIAVLGFLFCLIGPLIFLMPFMAKSEVQRAVERAVRDVQDEVEESDSRDKDRR